MIREAFTIFILVLAIPFGFWIAWLARDELRAGRQWLGAAIAGGIVLAFAAGIARQLAAAYTGIFITILAGIAYRKSFDRKWTKMRR